MFPGMFARKPDKEVAMKQLKSHVLQFGLWVAVVRVTPYLLHYFSHNLNNDNQILTLDL